MQREYRSAAAAAVLLLAGYGVALGTVVYVSPVGSAQPPYANWDTAAVTIQEAVDFAAAGDLILVTNGVFDIGGASANGALTNRVAVTNAVTVRSVNGPEFTFLVGSGPAGDNAVRCAYLGAGSRLEGFTLTNGHTRASGDVFRYQSGGGAYCEPTAVISNCVITGNTAWLGGGAHGGIMYDCILRGNVAGYEGGGAYDAHLLGCTIENNVAGSGGGAAAGCEVRDSTIYRNSAGIAGGGIIGGAVWNSVVATNTSDFGGGIYDGLVRNSVFRENAVTNAGGAAFRSTVENCTIVANAATGSIDGRFESELAGRGGGTAEGTIRNSIVWSNSAKYGAANWANGTVAFTCTSPNPGGIGNVTNDPQFVDGTLSDVRTSPASPCVDSGTNELWMVTARDLDGFLRIQNGLVDMGAYEVDVPGSDDDGDGLDDSWELARFLSLTTFWYESDWDGDGFIDGHEYLAGTNPTDASSYLRILETGVDPTTGRIVISWSSAANRHYTIHGTTNLTDGVYLPLQGHIPAILPANSYTTSVDRTPWQGFSVEVEVPPFSDSSGH